MQLDQKRLIAWITLLVIAALSAGTAIAFRSQPFAPAFVILAAICIMGFFVVLAQWLDMH